MLNQAAGHDDHSGIGPATTPISVRDYRPDLDGLRAIAILAVVAFHAKAPYAKNGFLGVDVFFVLSGFLITGGLHKELIESGRVRLVRFWARRIRRLLPAATVTVIGTMVGTAMLLPVTRWQPVTRTGQSAILYYTNVLLAVDSDDYFDAKVLQDPLMHFWSLAVEEQFYLTWPLLFGLIGWMLSRRRSANRRFVFSATLSVVGVISLAQFIWLTSNGSFWNYYASTARAWEFATGALAAVLLGEGMLRLTDRMRSIGHLLGLTLIATGLLLVVDQRTRFPGVWIVIPVLGAAMVCACLPPSGSWSGKLLALPPAVYLGRLSYSWYLWHWPVLVIGQRIDSPGGRSAQLIASLLLAALSYRLIENPIRYSNALGSQPRLNYALGLALIASGLATSTIINRVNESRIQQDPLLAAVADALGDLGENYVASLDCATNDIARLERDCVTGDTSASQTVLLLGDSHADHWQPALDQLGHELGFRLVSRIDGGCAAVPAGQNGRRRESCLELQAANVELFASVAPDVVVVSHSYTAGPIGEELVQDWEQGVRSLAQQASTSAAVVWIYDTPTFPLRTLDCLASEGPDKCNAERASATAGERRLQTIEAPILDALTSVETFDPTDLICGPSVCDPLDNGVPRYRDSNHLATSYSRSLAPALRPVIERALANRP